ncbi:unnamed protein product, partial [marine sediment metagenome]
MRYSILSRTISIQDLEIKCRQAGALNIKPRPLMKQVFCDLDPSAAEKLSRTHGIKVSPVKAVKSSQTLAPAVSALGEGLNLHDTYSELHQAYTPRLDGTGLTVALLDSGVRTTHEALVGKIILEENFSEAPTVGDIFGHGTNNAYIIAGEYNGRSGVAPGAKIMSMKALNNNGEGTDEMVVDAIERVCELVQAAIDEGLPLTDEMYPNTISISLGSEDDG